MESQKIINLLEETGDEELYFQAKKWHTINDQNNGQYGAGDQNDSTIKFNIKIVKPYQIDCSDAYISVIGNITVEGGDDNTRAAFKICHHLLDQ